MSKLADHGVPVGISAAMMSAFPDCHATDRHAAEASSASIASSATAPGDAPSSQEVPFSAEASEAAVFNHKGVAAGLEVAVFAGGCFWGMEELLRHTEGVVETQVGYAGGADDTASYGEVSTGTTRHAESVKVVYDPSKTTYTKLVQWFFRIHDPTTRDRQGHDVGTQYRSVIFYQTREQGVAANEVKAAAERSGKLDGPIATQIVPAMRFLSAEEVHQDYLQRHPDGYTCHFARPDIF